jgi:hypothetical protein
MNRLPAPPSDYEQNWADIYTRTIELNLDELSSNISASSSSSVPTASNGVFINASTVSTSYTIPSGDNGLSSGPISVASGQTVSVPSGSTWNIV